MITLLLLLAAPQTASAPATEPLETARDEALPTEQLSFERLKARVAAGPRKVAAFIERRAGCNHFAGEEPYDSERRAFLEKTIRELRCARIDRDERALRRQYRKQPAVLRLLDETAEQSGW
jgi:hypothetical protein